MMNYRIGLIALFTIVIGQQSSNAQLKTKDISIFKNGTAFIHKEGKVSLESSVYNWNKNLPNALYGTFWFTSSTGTIIGISSSQGEGTIKKNWSSYLELLKANTGKEAVLETKDGKLVKGKIYKAEGGSLNGTVVIKEANGYMFLRDSEIKSVKIEGSIEEKLDVKVHEQKIEIKYKESAKAQHLDAMYLTSGFSWTPMYKLDLVNDKKGKLNMRASVVNGSEDLKNVNLNLVVGSPNMYTTTQISDLVNFNTIRPTFKGRAKVMGFNNASSSFYEVKKDANFNGGAPKVAEGLEDLYLFKLTNISLKKGGRAFYPLFNTEVKLEHKYVTNLNNNASVNSSYYKKYASTTKGFQVNHQLKVWNHSSNPFSSGTIMVNSVSGGVTQAIATSVLDYTAINNCAYINLSKSPDIEIKEEEKEIERTGKTKYWNKNKYVAVKVESTITVKSYKSKDVSMEIKKLIYGELGESNVTWDKKGVKNHYIINEGNNVTWSLDLKAGSEAKITYTYTVFIRG